MTLSNATQHVLDASAQEKEDASKLFASRKQQLSSLEYLLDKIDNYKAGLEGKEPTLLNRTVQSIKKTYDNLMGTSYASSNLERTLKSARKDLTQLQEENYELRSVLEMSIDSLTARKDSVDGTLRHARAEFSQRLQEYQLQETNYAEIQNDIDSGSVEKTDLPIVESYLRQLSKDMDAQKDFLDLQETSIKSHEGVYEQLVQEVLQEKTFLEFQKQHESIIATNITLVDTYLQREQAGTDESALMKTKQVLLGSTNAMHDAQSERAKRTTSYESATKHLSPYAAITSSFADALNTLTKKIIGIQK